MKVIILGKGDMLANLIRGAVLAGVEIAGVLRYENLYLSKFQMFLHDLLKPSPELTLIKKHKIYDMKFKSANSKEFKKEVLRLNADIILVGTWSEKLDKEIINMPKIAAINVHPSLLPKYRGQNPYLQAIWHGEKISGVTFHLMTEEFDAGGILAQGKVEILNIDTGKELKNKTVFKARMICSELLSKLKQGCVEPVEQNEADATYFKEIKPEDMTLDFSKETSFEIMAHVRGFYPFRPTYIQDGDKFRIVNPYKMTLTDDKARPAEITNRKKNTVEVACKDGRVIRFEGLKRYINWNFYK